MLTPFSRVALNWLFSRLFEPNMSNRKPSCRFFFAVICPLLLAGSFSTGCELINPPEDIPAFIRIDTVTVVSDPVTQGTAQHNITETWVFIDNRLQGIYDYPVVFPVLNKLGKHSVKITGGIKKNGIASTRVNYPFYAFYETEVELAEEDTFVIAAPQIPYFSALDFWVEDFEDPGLKFDNNGGDTSIFATKVENEVFEGQASGKIVLTNGNSQFNIETSELFNFPVGKPVFLELHYKVDSDFTVGVVAQGGSDRVPIEALSVRPSLNNRGEAQWNKIYIDLSRAINQTGNAQHFELFVRADLTLFNKTEATFLFDNFKIVHP